MPGLAAFLEQADASMVMPRSTAWAHVVDGEQAHLDGGQGFHLDAGAADGFGGDGAADGVIAFDHEIGGDAGEGDRVAQGIRSAVRLAPWIAAIRAMPITSPSCCHRRGCGRGWSVASRSGPRHGRPGGFLDLAETSTMWAWPGRRNG